jgi:hypothetical protein
MHQVTSVTEIALTAALRQDCCIDRVVRVFVKGNRDAGDAGFVGILYAVFILVRKDEVTDARESSSGARAFDAPPTESARVSVRMDATGKSRDSDCMRIFLVR